MRSGGDGRPQLFDSSAAVPLVVLETYPVLTRMPAGIRRSPQAVFAAQRATVPETRFLEPDAALDRRGELAERGIASGAVFDALVGAVARAPGAPLVTSDRRARSTYDALGVRVIWPAGIDR